MFIPLWLLTILVILALIGAGACLVLWGVIAFTWQDVWPSLKRLLS